MVGRIILAIGAAWVVAFVVIFVVVPWVTTPARAPASTTTVIVPAPAHAGRSAAQDEALRRWLSGPQLPLTGYRKW